MNFKYPSIKWTKSKIECIIKNQTYTGEIAWDRRGGRQNPIKHENFYLAPINKDLSIVTKDTFNEVIDIRNKRALTCDPCMYTTPFILKNLLFCGTCKKKMIAKNPGKNKKNVYICECITKESTKLRIPQSYVEYYFFNHLSQLFSTKNKDNLEKYYEEYAKNLNSKKLEYETALLELERRIDNLKNYIAKLEFELIITKDHDITEAINNQISLRKSIYSEYENLKVDFKNKIELLTPTLDNYLSIREKLLTEIFNHNDESLNLKRRFVLEFIERIDVIFDNTTKQIRDLNITFS